jgi:uncharacterized phage infection (PIP) family protein YhgE
LDPLAAKLDAVNEAIRQLPSQLQQPAALPPPAADPGPNTAAALDSLSQGLTKTNQVVTAMGKAVQDNAVAVDELQTTIIKHGTFAEKLAVAKQQAAEEHPEAGKLKQDVEAIKTLIHQSKGFAIALVVAALVVLAVFHTIRTGRGPVHAVVEKLAEKHPDNATLQRLHARMEAVDERLGAIGDRLHSRVASVVGAAAGGAVAGAPGAAVGAVAPEVLDRLKVAEARIHDLALLQPSPVQPVPTAPPAAPAA